MTKEEFLIHMNKLIETFGVQQFPKSRIGLIFDEVKELNVDWWEALCRRMILEFNPKINIAEAARMERFAKNAVSRTEEMVRHSDESLTRCTDEGFQKIMQQLGGMSPSEILKKRLDMGA